MTSHSKSFQGSRSWFEYFAVFFGGAAGSILRELLPTHLHSFSGLSSSFSINLIACFVLGWLFAVRHRLHVHYMHLGAVGFCGGLSTFSAFTADIYSFLVIGAVATALLSSGVEIFAGVFAALLGEMLGRSLHGSARS